MSLTFRKGTQAEFDAGKSNILAGEPAFTTDEKRFFIGGANGSPVEILSMKYLVSLTTNSTITITVPKNFHGCLLGFHLTSNMAMYMISSHASSTYINATEISDSETSASISSDTITLTNNSSGTFDLYYFGTGALSYSL